MLVPKGTRLGPFELDEYIVRHIVTQVFSYTTIPLSKKHQAEASGSRAPTRGTFRGCPA